MFSPGKQPASPAPARSAAPARAVASPAPPVPVAARIAGPAPGHQACSCGGVCPACRAATAGAPAADFSGVRFQPSAPEVTAPLQARAVTIGQDIYFHPGQYRPGTPAGDRLIAHELAHTLQTRSEGAPLGDAGPTVSSPGDRLEENADALASGQTHHAEAAPVGARLRSPLDQETPTDHTRRVELLGAIQNAESHLLTLLSTGGLLAVAETTRTVGGVRGVWVDPHQEFISFTQRDAMIRRMIRNLIALAAQYQTQGIDAALPPASLSEDRSYSTEVEYEGGGTIFSGRSPAWAQLQGAYELYRHAHGQVGDEFQMDWYYLNPDNAITPGAARGAPRTGRGIGSGAYVVVPDMVNAPRTYRLINGFDAIPRGSPIIELWHDDFGYYYMNGTQRIDVDSPWSSDRPRH